MSRAVAGPAAAEVRAVEASPVGRPGPRSFTEHYAIGEEASRQFRHMHRVASLVPADRITRASEKTAQRSGLNLVVFTDEGEVLQWVLA